MEPPSDSPGNPDGPSDSDLIRRYQAGDLDAARRLFDRYVPVLRSRVRRKLPPAMRQKVAESDVIQETFMQVIGSLDDFEDRGEDAFSRWLARILENRILDEVRRFGLAQKRDLQRERSLEGVAPQADSTPTPSRVAMRAEERAALWHLIDDLPDDYRTVIRLVHREGLTVRSAAERMGRSVDAIYKLYGRALKRLEGLAHGS